LPSASATIIFLNPSVDKKRQRFTQFAIHERMTST
jgi:hypothetical protein